MFWLDHHDDPSEYLELDAINYVQMVVKVAASSFAALVGNQTFTYMRCRGSGLIQCMPFEGETSLQAHSAIQISQALIMCLEEVTAVDDLPDIELERDDKRILWFRTDTIVPFVNTTDADASAGEWSQRFYEIDNKSMRRVERPNRTGLIWYAKANLLVGQWNDAVIRLFFDARHLIKTT